MSVITLREIVSIAEQESARRHHYYIGIEHLFIAMTKLDRGLCNAVLEHCDMEPRFVRYSIRQAIGISENRRYWPSFKDTPRTQRVKEYAQHLAGIKEPSEREVLLAILEEGDSIPLRILREMGADLAVLRSAAANWATLSRADVPRVPIETTLALNADEQMVLRRMFRTHEKIVVERELGGSYSGARLLVVRPYRPQRVEARCVVKIDEHPVILHEKRHYDSYVKDTLPPTTARLLDNPSLPDGCRLGGLKYSLVQPADSPDPVDLKAYALQISGIELSSIIRRSIYDTYATTWWSQRQRYRFGVWREYEHVLPAAIEIYPEYTATTAQEILEPMGAWSRSPGLHQGDLVELHGFTVQKVRPKQGSVQLAAGIGPEAVNRSSKVEIIGLGEGVANFRPGDVVERFAGRVNRSRDDILLEQALDLQPSFNLQYPTIPAPSPLDSLPNPLHHYERYLDRQLSGYLSIIHGDLHLGNVLVGPAGDAWLIDFGLTREGHTLFDWALLEISLLTSVVGPRIPSGWDGVWGAVNLLNELNEGRLRGYHMNNPVADAIEAIKAVRQVVIENLVRPDDWQEYYLALTLLCLRGLSWQDTTTVDVRRLLFLVAGLSAREVNRAEVTPTTEEMTRDALLTQEIRNSSKFTHIEPDDQQ
ncbi:MAG: phosphotransferase [Anaerolineales bacterium]|nr:phosphotransferase [Anaerolineales bacterium]